MEWNNVIFRTLFLTSFAFIVSANVKDRITAAADLPEASPTPECVDTVTCRNKHFVAKCVTCYKAYFYCEGPGAQPVLKFCDAGGVFNPDPLLPQCLMRSTCPFHPPWTTQTTTPPIKTTTTSSTVPSTTTTTKPTTTTTSKATTTSTSSAAPPVTSTTSTSTTTTVPTTSTDCLDSLLCPDKGNFPRCYSCQQDYFNCEGEGQAGSIKPCPTWMVFNTDPTYPKCIDKRECPKHVD